MAKIIEKHDTDTEYIFTCPICGTIFTEIERNMFSEFFSGAGVEKIICKITCPNCSRSENWEVNELKEYKEE